MARSIPILALVLLALTPGCGEDKTTAPVEGDLAAPERLQVVARREDSITLRFVLPDGPVDRCILRRTRTFDGHGVTLVIPGHLEGTVTYKDQALDGYTAYAYTVLAVRGTTSSPWTTPVTSHTRPGAPTDLAAYGVSASEIRVMWTPHGSPVAAFELERREANGAWTALSTGFDEPSYLDTGLDPIMQYEYRVRTLYAADTTGWSGPVAASPLDVPEGPERVVALLQHAFTRRDVAAWQALLAHDFEFVTSRVDRLYHPDWPARWGRAADNAAVETFFADSHITDYAVSFRPGTLRLPDPTEGAPLGTWVLPLDSFSLECTTQDENGTAHTFSVGRVGELLYIRPEASDPGAGPWTIVEWREIQSDLDAGNIQTWAKVKQFYAPLTDVPATFVLRDAEAHRPQTGPDLCGVPVMNSGGSYRSACAWGGAGVTRSWNGAFAECYNGAVSLCAAVLDLTQDGNQDGQTMDILVWEDDGSGAPGAVVQVVTGVDPGPVARWPGVSRHWIPIKDTCLEGDWWIGWSGSWVGERPGWYAAVDEDGYGGCPMTLAAPGLDMPWGWVPASSLFDGCRALGIGAGAFPCIPVGSPRARSGP